MKEKGPDGNMINAEVAAMAEKNPALKTTIMDNITQAVKAGEAVKNKKATVIADNKVVSAAALETASLGKIARNEAMLSQYPLRNKRQQAAVAAQKKADMDEAYVYGTARKQAGDMYAQPVAAAGMVTSKARLPKPVSEAAKSSKYERTRNLLDENIYSRTAKSVLSASKVGDISEELNKALAMDANYPLIPEEEAVEEATVESTVKTEPEIGGAFEYKPHLRPEEKERQTMEVAPSTKPGWKLPQEFPNSTVTGNYYSADFEDEHWNTPAGINEAMGLWGRPVGNRYSGRYQATRNPFVNKKWDAKTNQYR